MKTAIVLSDTHGNRRILEKLYPLFEENDYIIHLGDGNRDMAEIYRAFPDKTFVCQGNCDFATSYSRDEWVLQIGDSKVLCCHGHRYRVKHTLEEYRKEAQECGCNVALYGHTHKAEIWEGDGMIIMNPGNFTLYETRPSYGYLAFNGDKVTAVIVPVQP